MTIEDYEKLIQELEAVSSDMGIYPQAMKGFGDERDYEQRDGYKNGWNACVMEYGQKISEVLRKAGEPWSEPERLFAASGEYYIFVREDDGWSVFLNDTWYYACADLEPIPPCDYEKVADLFRRFGEAGVHYWVSVQRGYDPQIPRYERRVKAVRDLIAAEEEERKNSR